MFTNSAGQQKPPTAHGYGGYGGPASDAEIDFSYHSREVWRDVVQKLGAPEKIEFSGSGWKGSIAFKNDQGHDRVVSFNFSWEEMSNETKITLDLGGRNNNKVEVVICLPNGLHDAPKTVRAIIESSGTHQGHKFSMTAGKGCASDPQQAWLLGLGNKLFEAGTQQTNRQREDKTEQLRVTQEEALYRAFDLIDDALVWPERPQD